MSKKFTACHGFRRIRRCSVADAGQLAFALAALTLAAFTLAAFTLVKRAGRFFDGDGQPELALEAIRERP